MDQRTIKESPINNHSRIYITFATDCNSSVQMLNLEVFDNILVQQVDYDYIVYQYPSTTGCDILKLIRNTGFPDCRQHWRQQVCKVKLVIDESKLLETLDSGEHSNFLEGCVIGLSVTWLLDIEKLSSTQYIQEIGDA